MMQNIQYNEYETQIEAINILAASYETQEKKKLRLAGGVIKSEVKCKLSSISS